MRLDERALGQPGVYAKLSSYVTNWLPTASDSPFFTNYGFSKPVVYRTANWTPIPLSPPLTGTNYGCKYQIIVTASNKYSQFQVPATVGLEINMVDQSIYHYSVFYGLGMDMEVCPGNDMTIRGSVYGGDDIYLNPSGHTLTISDDISAVSRIVKSNSPSDPSGYRTGGTVNTNGGSTTNAAPLVFTLSTNQSSIASNNPAAVHAVLDIPPAGEDPFGAVGTNRYYNKADVIVTVKDSNIVVQVSPFHTTTHTTVTLTDFPMGTNANAIIYTNDTLYDKRQGSYVKLTTVDIGNLVRYTSNTASGLAVATGSTNINTLYVVDQRTTNSVSVLTWQTTNTVNKILSTPPYTLQSMTITTNKGTKTTNRCYTYVSRTNTYSSSMPAIMLTNGTKVPYGGLTVATPRPRLYQRQLQYNPNRFQPQRQHL